MTLTADAHGKQYTNAVDVYSYGVLLWTMATRRQPYVVVAAAGYML